MSTCYAIIQRDHAGYFEWLREGEPQFAKHAILIQVIEGKNFVTLEKEAGQLLATLRRESVKKSS